MFLLTFALLIISMLGVYTQVYALETARLFAGQTGMAQNMLVWHEWAGELAANVINPNPTGGPPALSFAGCSLTATPWSAAAPAVCKTDINSSPGHVTPTGGYSVTADAAPLTYTVTATEISYPQRPVGYNTATYQWNSVAFHSGTSYYVLTFVSAATPGASVSTPTGVPLNLTEGDLYRQLGLIGVPGYSFGYVSNPAGVAKLVAAPLLIGGVMTPTIYNIPASIPDGALAIISFPAQCNGC